MEISIKRELRRLVEELDAVAESDPARAVAVGERPLQRGATNGSHGHDARVEVPLRLHDHVVSAGRAARLLRGHARNASDSHPARRRILSLYGSTLTEHVRSLNRGRTTRR